MRKFHSIEALCGDGLRPELKKLFERLAVDRKHPLGAAGSVGCARGRISRANGRASPVNGTGTGEFLS